MKYESNFQWGLPEPLHPCPVHDTLEEITWREMDDSRSDGRRLATLGCGCKVAIQAMGNGILDSILAEESLAN